MELRSDVFDAYREYLAGGGHKPTDKMSAASFYTWMATNRRAIHARVRADVTGLVDALDYYCVVLGVPR